MEGDGCAIPSFALGDRRCPCRSDGFDDPEERIECIRFFVDQELFGVGDDERVCLAGEPFEITEAFIECSPVLAKVIRELQSRTKLVEKPLIAPHLRTSDDA